MKKHYFLCLVFCVFTASYGQTVFINEIHYDNTGGDTNEGVEIAGPAGTDLTGYKVVLYNGNNGQKISNINLSGIIPNQENSRGTLWFSKSGIQNGAPDGLALVDASDTVIQFLSYEGDFTATDDVALGLTSVDIGVAESSATAIGHSLQLTGVGDNYTDFTWATPTTATEGASNTGQTLSVAENNIEAFAVFPNPVSDGLLSIKSKNNTNKYIEIYNLYGVLQYSKHIERNKTIDISALCSGLYLLKATEGSRNSVKKILIK